MNNINSNRYHNNAIPQVAHFIWSNRFGLPLTRFLSIAGFALMNRNFIVKVHTFDTEDIDVKFYGGEKHSVVFSKSRCYWQDLAKISNIIIVHHSIGMYTIKEPLPPSSVSDLLRWEILVEEGGWYFDTDILFFRPFNSAYFNARLYSNYNCFINASKKYIPPLDAVRIGILACEPSCRLFSDTYSIAMKEVICSEYQSAGAMPLSVLLGIKPFREWSDRYPDCFIHNIHDSFLYRYETSTINRALSKPVIELGWGAYQLGFHWYGGAFAESVTSYYDIYDEFMPEQLLDLNISNNSSLIFQCFLWSYGTVRSMFNQK